MPEGTGRKSYDDTYAELREVARRAIWQALHWAVAKEMRDGWELRTANVECSAEICCTCGRDVNDEEVPWPMPGGILCTGGCRHRMCCDWCVTSDDTRGPRCGHCLGRDAIEHPVQKGVEDGYCGGSEDERLRRYCRCSDPSGRKMRGLPEYDPCRVELPEMEPVLLGHASAASHMGKPQQARVVSGE